MRPISLPVLVSLAVFGLAGGLAEAAPRPKLELAPCTTIPGLPPEARCGTYEVWENRAARSGRKIPLRVVVLPATGPDRLSDPFIYFEGGPGQSSVAAASWIAQELGELRKRRDVLLVDFRGTGGSAGLFCPELQGRTGLQGSLDNFYPPEKVRACAERLKATADLGQYTNDTSVDDVNEVRAALGYDKLNIYGASGGSRAALVYLRRHPETVRTLILEGVVPMDERGPFYMARSVQRALDGLIAECEGDESCRAAFPKLRDEVAAVLRQVEREPVTVALTDDETGQPEDLRLTRNGMAQILRAMLYSPLAASQLPLKVHLAAQGNWKPLAEHARFFASRGGTSLADGYYLSLTCSEDVPFIGEDEIPAIVQGTFLGDLRIRGQQAACTAWPVPAVSRAFLDPVTSDVPTLLLSGERDPVTPPGNAERAARTLRNSRHVIVPDGGHGYGGIEGAYACADRLIVQFVESGTLQGLDTSCMTRTKRTGFALKQAPDVEVPVDQLARLTGTYKERESGFEIRVEAVGKRLRIVNAADGSIQVLAAASPTRFRMEGASGTLTFQLSNGRAAAVVFESPGAPSLTLARADLAAKLELSPCTGIPGLPPEARCGTYEVWENRAARSGRKIPLRVLVIPATGPDRQPDPFVFFNGGPGESSVAVASWLLQELGALRRQRDILLVDFRGTGGSAGLFCPEMQKDAGLQGSLDNYLPPEPAKACGERLAKTADLSQYTNDTSVDDVDEVRAALGYPEVNLFGGSGGSRSVLVYLRRHPDKVRTAVIGGVVPTDERGPFSMARHAQRALDGLIAECEADAACQGAFPRLRDEVAAVLQRAAKEPVTAVVTAAGTGKPVEIRLTRAGVVQILRYMLYKPLPASFLPLAVHLAAQGDWKLLAESAAASFSGLSGTADGYYLSLTCSEDVPFIREDEVAAAVQGTFLGDFRIRAQQAACASWPVPPVDRKFLDPVVSDVPTLLLSGERDPVTPPGNAERAARTLQNSLHVVIPDAGHDSFGIAGAPECMSSLIIRFVETGTVQGLDTSCATRTKRPEFALQLEPDLELTDAQLARFAGTYKDPQSGYEIRVETVGGRLRVIEGEDPPVLLAATSPTRFRMQGMPPGSTYDFQIQDGRATACTTPWAPERPLQRVEEKGAAAQAPKLELAPCTNIPGLPPEARCGTYEVWENRAARSGRKIPLRVLVIPATGPGRLPDAITLFGGGPGESSVAIAPDVVQMFGALRKNRDILLVDFRGTGESGGLFCPEMQGARGLQDALDSYLPPDKVKACAERLAKTADLSQYTNDTSVDDVDEVRAALGYEKLNIYGGSGGSRSALVYLRRHPDKVRTAILSGVAPPDERGPFSMALHAQRALDGLIAECEADAACHGAFPRLRDEVAAVLRRVEKEPVTVTVTDNETGKPMEVRLTRSGVAQTLRYMLYRPLSASMLPLNLHLAAQGDWKPLAESAVFSFAGGDLPTIADGYYLSLTCSEDLPFIREDEIPAVVQGTFLGDFRIRKQQAACAVWPVPPVDRAFLEPVVSDVPTLLLSGERDPATPPASAERAARTLRNSLHVVMPDSGHGSFGITGALECLDGLMNRFIEAGTVQGLDTSCVAKTKRPEFALKREPDVELPADQLARLAGTYKDPESGHEVRIETVGKRLRLFEGEYPPVTLVALSPSRFRVEGMPPSFPVEFQMTEGRATSCKLPWSPELPLQRVEATATLKLEPCTTIPGLPPESRCGTYEVWENRAAKSGRKIPLRVVVIPATGPDRLPDAITLFSGGPGESSVTSAAEAVQMFGALRDRRDILLVDFRGTGGSGALLCPELKGNAWLQGALDHNRPPEKVRACAERLAKTADLSQYNNDNSIDDIDEVRAALGYEKLNLHGGSAGSKAVQVYLRRHPDKVRTAILSGLVPMDELGPFYMANHVQRALDGLIAECAGDAACHGAFPRLRDEVAAVLQRAEKDPVTVTVSDGATGRPIDVRLTRNAVAQTLRYMLYKSFPASFLPLTVHRAAQGDWKLMAESAASSFAGLSGIADGYYLSLTCSEELPFIREEEIPAAVQGSFLRDFRIRKQQAACAVWPVPPVDRAFLDPVVSNVPALLLSGERDPVTPAGNGERVARTLENSLHVVMPDGAHGSFGIEGATDCEESLMVRLIETGTVKGLDTSCVARTKRPEFVLKHEPDVELPADQLTRLAGTYKDPETGFEVRVETVGRNLRVFEGEYPPVVLMATSPTRFRVEGMPSGFSYEFQIKDGRSTACTSPWAPKQVMKREG